MSITKVLYQIIHHQDNTSIIKPILEKKNFNWELLYKIASKHLMIPALHNAFISKRLKPIIPKDFFNAIAHITELNADRNQQIIKQIKWISALFSSENIDCVLVKGAALLILNPYRNLSDRMVGDIDILVREKDIIRANNLLLNMGYKAMPKSPDPAYKNHRHLPRLISENEIAAVELHNSLLRLRQDFMDPNTVLDHKIWVDNHYISTTNHLYSQSILSYQINDNAYYNWHLSFKVLYDCLSLKNACKLKLDNAFMNNKYIRRFNIINALYTDNQCLVYSPKEKKQIAFFKWRKKHLKFNKFYENVIYFYLRRGTFLMRLWYLIKDKKYRRYVFQPKKPQASHNLEPPF